MSVFRRGLKPSRLYSRSSIPSRPGPVVVTLQSFKVGIDKLPNLGNPCYLNNSRHKKVGGDIDSPSVHLHLEASLASTPLGQSSLKLLMLLSIITNLNTRHHSINSLTKRTSTSSRTIRMRVYTPARTNHDVVAQVPANLINMTNSNTTTRHRHRRLNMLQRKLQTLRNHQKLVNQYWRLTIGRGN